MSGELLVRDAEKADVPAVAAIYAYHVLHGTGTFELTPPGEAEIASRLASVQERGLPWFVAEREGEVVGYAYAGPFRTRPAYDWIVEDSIYIRDGCLRQGIGNALLGELLDRCTALGYRQMVALIGDSANAGSIELHRRFGFADAGRMTSVGWKHGRWLDVVLMQKALGPGDAIAAGVRPRQNR